MYSVKSIIDWNATRVDLPTCMYHMKPLYSDSSVSSSADSRMAVHLTGTSVDAAPNSQESVLEMISCRQDQLIIRLNHLKHEMEKFLGQSNTAKPIQKTENKRLQLISDQTSSPKRVLLQNRITDIVINAHPSQMPTSLFIIKSFLLHHHPILVSSFVHSSAKDITPPRVRNCFGSTGALCPDRNFYKYGLTFIWKQDKNTPSMMILPGQQVAVVGEYNIARYLYSLIPGSHESLGNALTAVSDELIDNAAAFHRTGSPDLQDIIAALDKQLSSKQKYLLADTISLADIILWPLLFSSKGGKEKLTDNVKKWFDHCSELPEFKNAI